jgi:hypothetical protein
MSQAERFEHLLREFERVGVDPNTISAGLAVRQEDALRVLSSLPDGALFPALEFGKECTSCNDDYGNVV